MNTTQNLSFIDLLNQYARKPDYMAFVKKRLIVPSLIIGVIILLIMKFYDVGIISVIEKKKEKIISSDYTAYFVFSAGLVTFMLGALLVGYRMNKKFETVYLHYDQVDDPNVISMHFPLRNIRDWYHQNSYVAVVTGKTRIRARESAGANQSLFSQNVTVSNKAHRLTSNIELVTLKLGNEQCIFLPDYFLIFNEVSKSYSIEKYDNLNLDIIQSPMIWHRKAPSDATITGYSWHYVNVDGSPDRRRKDNWQVPSILFGLINWKVANNFYEIYFSNLQSQPVIKLQFHALRTLHNQIQIDATDIITFQGNKPVCNRRLF